MQGLLDRQRESPKEIPIPDETASHWFLKDEADDVKMQDLIA